MASRKDKDMPAAPGGVNANAVPPQARVAPMSSPAAPQPSHLGVGGFSRPLPPPGQARAMGPMAAPMPGAHGPAMPGAFGPAMPGAFGPMMPQGMGGMPGAQGAPSATTPLVESLTETVRLGVQLLNSTLAGGLQIMQSFYGQGAPGPYAAMPPHGYGPPHPGFGPPHPGFGPPHPGFGPPHPGFGPPPHHGWGHHGCCYGYDCCAMMGMGHGCHPGVHNCW